MNEKISITLVAHRNKAPVHAAFAPRVELIFPASKKKPHVTTGKKPRLFARGAGGILFYEGREHRERTWKPFIPLGGHACVDPRTQRHTNTHVPAQR